MHYMLDVALATVIAISLSRLGTDSIFDRIVRLRSLPYIYDLKYIPKPIYAKDIMIHNITPLDNIVSYKYLKEFMDKQSKEKKTTYYPVIDHERKQLLGSVPRSEIEHILKKFDDEPEKVLSTKKFHLRYDKVQFTVMKDTSLQQIHLFFITGHLSFAFVTHEGSPVGLITREELANALEGQYQFV